MLSSTQGRTHWPPPPITARISVDHPDAELVDVVATSLLGSGFALVGPSHHGGPGELTAVPRLPGWVAVLDHVGVLRVVLAAPVGSRNASRWWAACRLWERVRDGQLEAAAADGMLRDAAVSIRLGDREAAATIASARRTVLGG